MGYPKKDRGANAVRSTCNCACCCCRHPHTGTELSTVPSPNNSSDQLLRVPEFAELLGIPEGAVRDLVKTGRITISKFGRSVYIERAEAARIKRESRRPATRPLSHNRFAA